MWNFVWGEKIKLYHPVPQTKFQIQKYDGLENIGKRSCTLEVTLSSGTDPNLGHTKFSNHNKS